MSAWLLALLLVAPVSGDKEAILGRLERAGRSLRTMQASFVETRVLVLLDEEEESRGDVALQVPGRLRWTYTAPREGVMIIRDGEFSRYFPKSNQVFRGQAKGGADLLVGFGPGAAELGSKYDVTLVGEEVVSGARTHVLDLAPRPAGGGGLFSGIRLWVHGERHIPVQTRLTEPTGDYTTIRFENVVLDDRLPRGTFDLDLPGNVVELK